MFHMTLQVYDGKEGRWPKTLRHVHPTPVDFLIYVALRKDTHKVKPP